VSERQLDKLFESESRFPICHRVIQPIGHRPASPVPRGPADGGFARRGGQSGQPTSYQLRCSFIFSAINNPLHLAQDLSRVAILRLMPLAAGKTKAPALAIETTGRILLAIIMREWPRFEALREEYMGALAAPRRYRRDGEGPFFQRERPGQSQESRGWRHARLAQGYPPPHPPGGWG
jgi:hypothetical protein